MAIASSDEFAGHRWPLALSLTAALVGAGRKMNLHEAAQPPTPRYLNVLMHAVRHLRFLQDTDADALAAMSDHWRTHLQQFEPSLAGISPM